MSSTNAPAVVAASSDALPEALAVEDPASSSGGGGEASSSGGGGEPAAAKVEPARAPDQPSADALTMVFRFLDSKTLLIAVPAVCKRWQGLCAELMPPVNLDVGWATTGPEWAPQNPLTDAGLTALAGRFRIVQGAELHACHELTDGGIERLAAGCPNLNHLNLRGCTVTDVGIERLAAGCPKLNHLYLDNCTQVTDVGIERLAAGCPNLNHLNLRRCDQVTDARISDLLQAAPTSTTSTSIAPR